MVVLLTRPDCGDCHVFDIRLLTRTCGRKGDRGGRGLGGSDPLTACDEGETASADPLILSALVF